MQTWDTDRHDLEYSRQWGMFHYASVGEASPPSWSKIDTNIDGVFIEDFVKHIEKKFNKRIDKDGRLDLTVFEVKQEYSQYKKENMKISYRSHVGISIVETGNFKTPPALNVADAVAIDTMRKGFLSAMPKFKPIRIISSAMRNALNEASEKMITDDIWNNVGECNGTIILKDFVFCYEISSNNRIEHDFTVYVFYKGEFMANGFQSVKDHKRIINVGEQYKWMLSHVKRIPGNKWAEDVFEGLYTTLIATINFLKYAEIEDKHIKANSKEVGIACKYINETKSDVHYITSHWITNLYVTGAFKVRGHFRLQACGEGHKERRLIWVNEFQKEGYTAKARMLSAAEG